MYNAQGLADECAVSNNEVLKDAVALIFHQRSLSERGTIQTKEEANRLHMTHARLKYKHTLSHLELLSQGERKTLLALLLTPIASLERVADNCI